MFVLDFAQCWLSFAFVVYVTLGFKGNSEGRISVKLGKKDVTKLKG